MFSQRQRTVRSMGSTLITSRGKVRKANQQETSRDFFSSKKEIIC